MNTNVEERKSCCESENCSYQESETCSCQESEQKTDRQAEIERLLAQSYEEKPCANEEITDERTLQSVYKVAKLGLESAEILAPLTKDKGYQNLLLKQYKEYNALAKEIELYCSNRKLKLVDNTIMQKAMMSMSANINTLMDKSNSKLSEIMIQGVNMGIITLTRIQNQLADKQLTNCYADQLMALLQQNLEDFKLFLQ